MYLSLSYLFFLSLFAATTEQILWRGDSSQLFFLPFIFAGVELLARQSTWRRRILSVFLVVLSVIAFDLFVPKFLYTPYEHIALVAALLFLPLVLHEERSDRYISPCIYLSFITLVLFSFYANLGQREYFIMANEPVGLFVYADLWSLIALVSLSFSALRAKRYWLLLTCLFAVIVWLAGFWSSTQAEYFEMFFVNDKAVGQYRLASCFLLLAYYAQNGGLQQATGVLWRGRYAEKVDAYLPVLILSSVIIFALSLRGLLNSKQCIQERDSYRISEEMALHLFVAEDPLYYYHRGVEFHAMRIVVARFLETGERRFGGSTISMQLAKVCYLSPERLFYRKLKQLFLGLWLEQKFNKRDILAAYLENIQFSPETRGLSAASRSYYQKEPSQLNIEESLSLILSIQDPFGYNLTMGRPPNIVRQRGVVTKARLKRFRKRLQRNIKKLMVVAEHQ